MVGYWEKAIIVFKYWQQAIKSIFIRKHAISVQTSSILFWVQDVLLREMKWFYLFVLKAMQGIPYPLLFCLLQTAFVLLANQPGWNAIF